MENLLGPPACRWVGLLLRLICLQRTGLLWMKERRMKMLSEEKKREVEKMVEMARRLDENSLIILTSNASVLFARKQMEERKEGGAGCSIQKEAAV